MSDCLRSFLRQLPFLVVPVLLGCASGPCPEKRDPKAALAVEDPRLLNKNLLDRVQVAKPDGSQQCGMKEGMSPDSMKKELGPIKVYASKSLRDPRPRIQLCGSATGQMNVYEIDRQDLEKARQMGFQEWLGDNP